MSSTSGQVAYGSTTGRAIVAAAVLGSGLTLLDGTVVNVALRTIGRDLGASLSQLQWISNGYLLTMSALILLGGSLGDRYGRRRIFVIGTIWFALASLLCGIAPSATVLILARILQGIGAAMLTPGSLAMIQGAFEPESRARAIGSWSGLGSVAAAIGPFVAVPWCSTPPGAGSS
jgi:MFS family permease